METSRVQLRRDLLRTAVEIARPLEDCLGTDPVLEIADQLYAWVLRPMQLKPLMFGVVSERASGEQIFPYLTHPGQRPIYTDSGATFMNLQLGDSQQVTATAVALDADGQPTADTLTWVASIPAAVSLTPSADTMSCLIDGLVPTVNVTITATDSLGNTSSGELDVVAGPATSLSLQFGAVSDRPAAPAPAPAPASGATTATAPTTSTAPATPAEPAAPAAGTASA